METKPGSESSPAGRAAQLARSNANAEILLEVFARFQPESAGFVGVTGVDDQVIDLGPHLAQRSMAATEAALKKLRAILERETSPAVRQDLEILVHAGELELSGTRLQERLLFHYFDLGQTVFQGIRALLDPQVAPERRASALVRLRRYAGLEGGARPVAVLMEERLGERLRMPGLLPPFRGEIEKDLGNLTAFVDGIGELFKANAIAAYEEPLAALRQQLGRYESFLRAELLPRARSDFRQPPEVYALDLERMGVDLPIDELASRARVAFKEIQFEMRTLAPLVAAERGITAHDYRDVLKALKREQIVGEAILPHYERRIADIEALIRAHDVITLPDRPMRFRLASEAESAATPAPHMRPPRLVGNTGEMGEFVLPLRIPRRAVEAGASAPAAADEAFDDFTFDAVSWTLSVHEGRPGHELQFAALVERGVSTARAVYAMNSVNCEGWALYSEAEMKPWLPLDGQLGALQHRLLRAARAFLDPGLQAGSIDREEARRVLCEDVVLSEAMARQEIERYTFWAPGQATTYFCGYVRLMELRTEVERRLGARFDRRRYHDFILAQGLLPPALLRQAVLEDFVPAEEGS